MDAFDQAEALIRHWLGQEPAEENDDYLRQIRQAIWLEDRHNEALARLLGVKK